MANQGVRATLAAAVTVVLLGSTAAPAGADTGADPTRIHVLEKSLAPAVQDTIVGANHRWPKGGLGMWDAEKDRASRDIVDLSRRTNLALVRYPGGTVANLFDFRKAIGDQEDRGCQVGGGFVGGAEPYDSVYGPDEHQDYVEEIGAETEVMVSSVLPTDHAADFVEYMNARVGTNPRGGVAWAEVRAENGHRDPYGVKWWEVGNEIYLGNQTYWRSEDLDERLRQYAFGGKQRQTGQRLGTECDHRKSAGVSDGTPGQTFQVWYPPVTPGSLTLYVGGEKWRRVRDLDAAEPKEKVYELDGKTGDVRFGDGDHGRVPQKDAALTVDYISGPHPGFVDYYREMKKVDPTIEVCSNWAKAAWVELMGTKHPYDCVGPHLYSRPKIGDTPAEVHDELISLAPQVLGELEALEDAFRATFGNEGQWPTVEVSEYGAIPARGADAPPGYGGWVSRMLYDAELVAGMIERGVPIAANSNLNRGRPAAGELFGGAPDFHYTARARMLTLYSRLVGSTPVRTEVENNPDATGGGYSALRILSTRSADGKVRLVVLNRDRKETVSGRLHVDGLTGERTMRAHTLTGPGVGSYNTAENEDVVDTTVTTRHVSLPDLSYRFPPHSMVVLEF